MKNPKTLKDCFKDPRVESFSDERGYGLDQGDGIWLYLNEPWWCPDTDNSCVHEWTVKETIASLCRCYQNQQAWDRANQLNAEAEAYDEERKLTQK